MEVIINGVQTHYIILGEGNPLLIFHGWGSNSQRWLEVGEKIANNEGFRVIIPDLPGFGESAKLEKEWNVNDYVNWADGFIEHLKLKDFYILGHSFGGALACKMAMKHSQDIKKIFLVASASIRRQSFKKTLFKNMAKMVKIFSFLPYYALFRRAVYKYVIRKSDYPSVDGFMKKTYLNVISENLSFHLPFIRSETIIIWGDQDNVTPIEEAKYIQSKVRGSILEMIPGAGHDLNRKHPDLLAQKIVKHLP